MRYGNFYPAHSSNYTRGRGKAIKEITIHHSAGMENTLRYLWGNPSRNASSHFYVHPSYVEQYVDTNDTAWTNSVWSSNQESITIEVRGDWRGYYDQATLNQLQGLLVALRRHYPTARLGYHNDHKATICPAELKSKGYAKNVWDNAWKVINPPVTPKPPTPAPKPQITYKPVEKSLSKLKRNANLWDFNFTSWSKAKAVKEYPAGHVVEVVAIATNQLGAKYAMTQYSYDKKITNGFNSADLEPVTSTPEPDVPVIPEPPVKPPVEPPVQPPTLPVPTLPIPTIKDQVDQNTEDISKIKAFLLAVGALISKIFGK